jgi:hypothetical protein
MNFEKTLQEWLSLDDEIKEKNQEIKELRDKKNKLEELLNTYASSNDFANKTVRLNDEKIKFVDTKIQQPLSFKYLEKSLNAIIKNETHVLQILEYLKTNRETKIVPEIKRF